MTTDKVLVTKTDNGKYAITGGLTDAKAGLIVISTNKTTSANATAEALKDAVTLDKNNNLTSVQINPTNISLPLSDPQSRYEKGYQAAYIDSGMKNYDTDPNNAYQSNAEQIHGVGAHEEIHLTEKNMESMKIKDLYDKAYNAEKPAFEAEMKAREEWMKMLDL
jgi:hypothetical protein